MPAGAWGQKPSDAIRAPPTQASQAQKPSGNTSSAGGRSNTSSSSTNNKQQNRHGRGGGRGGTGSGGRGRGRGHHNTNNPNQNQSQPQQYHRSVLNVDLLIPGEGSTALQKKVKRFTANSLLQLRLQYLGKPVDFNPPDHCAWIDDNRIEEIQKTCDLPSKLGDVSKVRRPASVVNTAPPLEECKPLMVNDDTRWKSKVFVTPDVAPDDAAAAEVLDDQQVLKKALLILNKLSLTKFDKLSQEFVDTGIGRNPTTLSGAVNMIVDKAQSEPHFSSMYAQLCLFLTKVPMEGAGGRKAFKKLLLSRCQAEFEDEMSNKIAKAIKGIDDPEEQAYHEGIIKKKYLGHMRFIGELYKGDLIKLEVMLFCLGTLLEGYEEEKIECFAKLISTVGFPLEQQSAFVAQSGKPLPQQQLNACWKKVDEIASEGSSARIKFMLLDLKEMRDKGWITRRKEEKVMTIAEIHEEVAKEEAHAARRSSSSRNVLGGTGSLRRSTSDIRSSRPMVDQDGFVQIVPSRSSGNLVRATSDLFAAGGPPQQQTQPKPVRRAQSFSVAPRPTSSLSLRVQQPTLPPGPIAKPGPSLEEIEKKSKTMLKEYFVSGDLSEAVLTVDEIVGIGKDDGSVKRGTKLVETCVLLVLEGKPDDVDKMLVVVKAAHEQSKIADKCFLKGLDDPLEFLSDIEIDAPSARKFMVKIVAEFAGFAVGESFEAAASAVGEKK